MPLTPEEKKRIYEEEHERLLSQEIAKNDIAYAQPFSWGKYIVLVIICALSAFFPLLLLYLLWVAPALGIKDPGLTGLIIFDILAGCVFARIFYRPVQRPM